MGVPGVIVYVMFVGVTFVRIMDMAGFVAMMLVGVALVRIVVV